MLVQKDGVLLDDIPVWHSVQKTFRVGNVPHCWALTAPLSWHSSIFDAMSRMYLCEEGTGDDGCQGCRGWSGGDVRVHPDLMVVGEFEKAANIEMCREFIRELSLKPVVSKRRLGVVLAADKLLIHAANSLLKLAEEPPSHVCLLFMLSGSDFLPTLRSRSRSTTIAASRPASASAIPSNEAEWLFFLEQVRDEKTKDHTKISELMSGWVSCCMQSGDLLLAARTEKLRLVVEQKRLSQNMICDLLTLTLKEEFPFEHIFGDIR